MKLLRILVLTFFYSWLEVAVCSGQQWSPFLDPSRAITWAPGFAIPAYTTACATTVSLATGSGNAANNAASITAALASCDVTHNVVNLPAGTYYVAGFFFGNQGKQVLRGAGPNSTYIYSTTNANCGGYGGGICMMPTSYAYSGSASVLPPSGNQQCLWTAGYSQGTTSITLNTCPGGGPPVNQMLILDQANDPSDTGGVYQCDGGTSDCTYEGFVNADGRVISGILHSEVQVVHVTGVSGSGTGPYTVTISPGLYHTNIRSGQSPGAWWAGFVQNDGIENMTLDYSQDPTGPSYMLGVTMLSCYQCWMKNVRNIDPARNAVEVLQSTNGVIRDSYFYSAQSHTQTSYNIEFDLSSAFLIENNIMQQTTQPLTFNGSSAGTVVDYNFAVDNTYTDSTWTWGIFGSHATGNNFNLFEGNITTQIGFDNASGPANQVTLYRNLLSGYKPGTVNLTIPLILRGLERDFNFVGNVLGQPGYHTNYQAYATSTTTFSGAGSTENVSVYTLGAGGTGGVCSLNPPQSTLCDPLTVSTAMRWGNYDVVNAANRWNSTEAAPVANTYVNANFTTGYFNTLAQTLPASLFYSSTPSWWPSGKAWPPIGPDVTTGNVGICTGVYAGSMATNSTQCTGGSLSSAWASHVVSNPAMECYLSTMNGPPDGSGSALTFNATNCYSVTGVSLTISTSGPGAGTVTGPNCSTNSYVSGTVVGPCVGNPSSGSSLSAWSSTGSVSCSGTGTCPASGTFNLTATTTINAAFSLNSYTLSTSTTGTGSGTVVCTPSAGSVTFGTSVSCAISPAGGSSTTTVSGCGGTWSSSPYLFTMPAGSCNVTATFQGTVATPTFAPAAGSYSSGQRVAIGSTTPGSSCFYTVNSSTTPTTSSAKYDHKLNIAQTQTLKAICSAPGYTNSGVATGLFTIAKQRTQVSLSPVTSSQVPVPNPNSRICCGPTVEQIEPSNGTFDWSGYDPWIATAAVNNWTVTYTYSARPSWMTGSTNGDGPPSDLNTVTACGTVGGIVLGNTTDCFWKTFVIRHLMHVTGLSTVPSSPVNCSHLDHTEGGNEVNTDSSSAHHATGWNGTVAQIAQVASDGAVLEHLWCSNTLVSTPSVSAIVGFHANGDDSHYDVYLKNMLTAWQGISGTSLPDETSIHMYPARGTVSPVPFPTSNVNNGSTCTSVSCYIAVYQEASQVQGPAVLQSVGLAPTFEFLPVNSTEGGIGQLQQLCTLTSGTQLCQAYVSEYLLAVAAQNVPVEMLYAAFDSPCGPTNWGCYWESAAFTPSLWLQALNQTNSWLNGHTITGALAGTTACSGKKWTLPLETGFEIDFYDGYLTTCSAPTSFNNYQDLAGVTHGVTAGAVPLTQAPVLLFNATILPPQNLHGTISLMGNVSFP